jgi:hypothetical protein
MPCPVRIPAPGKSEVDVMGPSPVVMGVKGVVVATVIAYMESSHPGRPVKVSRIIHIIVVNIHLAFLFGIIILVIGKGIPSYYEVFVKVYCICRRYPVFLVCITLRFCRCRCGSCLLFLNYYNGPVTRSVVQIIVTRCQIGF